MANRTLMRTKDPEDSADIQLSSPIGIVAGNGDFPVQCAAEARRMGLAVVAVAHRGETKAEFEEIVDRCVWVRLGQLGKVIKTFRRHGVQQVVFAGGITRSRTLGKVWMDLTGLRFVRRLRNYKDDGVLRALAAEFEQNGLSVVPCTALLERGVVQAGVLSRRGLTATEERDARVGWDAAKLIGDADIGQTAVVKKGTVIAVEAVEGTDKCLERAGQLGGRGVVVVKVSKPNQDMRFDVPTVGPDTLMRLKEIGATALVLDAGKSIMLDPEQVIQLADEADIALVVWGG